MDKYNDKSQRNGEGTGLERKNSVESLNKSAFDLEKSRKQKMIFENLDECKWLSCKEVSELLSISENALRIMVYKNQIQAYKLGRRLRFKYLDCVSLLQKKGAGDAHQ